MCGFPQGNVQHGSLLEESKQVRMGWGKGQGQMGTQTLKMNVRSYIPVVFLLVFLGNKSLCLAHPQRESIAHGYEYQEMSVLGISMLQQNT